MAPQTPTFHIGSVLPLTGDGASAACLQALEGVCELGFDVSVLAEGDRKACDQCFALAQKYPGKFRVLEGVPKNKASIITDVDAMIFFTKPDRKLLDSVMREGVVPVAPESCGVFDFDPIQEAGNGFTFSGASMWDMFAAIIHCQDTFRFSYDWKMLKKNVEES